MIDNLILGTTHGLLLLTAWRLINRRDLDDERATPDAGADHPRKRRWGRGGA